MLDADFKKGVAPIICVMIVTYRSDATIERCLRSLERQTFREFEVVIVDNGLTPSLHTLILDSQLNVRIMHASDNLGFAAGNNLAAEQASPSVKWLAMLNPDAFAQKDWLESFMKAQLKYPKVAMFGSLQLEDTREGFCDGMGDSYHVFGLAWRRGHGRLLPDTLDDTETFSPCAAASFYRLDAFRALGGFDEDYFCYFEDVDLGFRARLAFGPCIQLADVIVSHVSGASGTSDFAIYHALRNIVWTYLKNMPAPFVVLFFPGMLAATVTLAIRYTFSGHGRAAWNGIYEAYKNMGGAWQKRKAIQETRRSSLKALLLSMTWLPLQPLSHLCRPRDRQYFSQ